MKSLLLVTGKHGDNGAPAVLVEVFELAQEVRAQAPALLVLPPFWRLKFALLSAVRLSFLLEGSLNIL